MTTGADAGPAADELQFDRALPSDASAAAGSVVCSGCHAPISDRYYQVGGAVACAACQERVQREQEELAARGRGAGSFSRALLFGLGAAVAGAAIYYAVAAITGWELALVALLIGYMVGWAVRRGSRGVGGRRYQVVAMLLTYFSVGLAYTPIAVKAARAGLEKRERATAAARAGTTPARTGTVASREAGTAPAATARPSGQPGAAPATAATSSPQPDAAAAPGARVSAPADRASKTGAAAGRRAAKDLPLALLGLVLILLVAILASLVLPILVVVGSLPSGLLSAVIIAVGMQQAWKLTRATPIPISGPYELGARAGVGPA